MKAKRSVYNVLFGVLNQLLLIALGIFLPRLILVNLGSESNGLLNSVNQIFAYFTLLEAGVGAAALQALYGPVGMSDHKEINQILAATDRYYKLPNYDKGVLVILNTGSGLLSITNLKITFNADPKAGATGEGEELDVPMTITEGERDMAVMSLRMRAMAPVVPDETVPEEPVPEETLPEETLPEETVPEVFEPGEFSVKVPKDAPKAGHKIKVDVTTSADVAYVVINGQKVTDYKEKKGPKDKAKTRTWKLDVIFDGEEYMEIEVVAYNEDDLASEPVSNVVTLKKPGKKK